MIAPEALIKLFGYSAELIYKQTATLTHAQSLLPLPFAGNSYNWILGHIISSRSFPLTMVGARPVWCDAERQVYRHTSANITSDGPNVKTLEALIDAFAQSQERLIAGLREMTFAQLCAPSGYADNTVGDSLGYFHFHEAHHVGQLLYLAQHAGKPGVWLA